MWGFEPLNPPLKNRRERDEDREKKRERKNSLIRFNYG